MTLVVRASVVYAGVHLVQDVSERDVVVEVGEAEGAAVPAASKGPWPLQREGGGREAVADFIPVWPLQYSVVTIGLLGGGRGEYVGDEEGLVVGDDGVVRVGRPTGRA